MSVSTRYEPIAIVGRAVVLPGALSPHALWELVASKRSAVTSVPTGRFGLEPDLVRGTKHAPVDKTWSTRGGYVDTEAADVALSEYPGRSDVRGLDPLFGWVLGTAHRALVDAGFDRGPVSSSHRGGIVFGNLSFPSEQMVRLGEALALPSSWRAATGRTVGDVRDRFMSGLPARMAAKHLGLDAFATCLDAACASSLYAVHLAARALQSRRADVVVAGAVNRADSLFLHVGFTALQALSMRGVPRPFDVDADGLVPAEGAAALTLMRLHDARREGRPILGVITGSALSNDGRQKSLLAPSSEGQARAVRAAWSAADASPHSAGFFECHATGTQTGDRTEVETLASILGDEARAAPMPLSSLKSNLGHLITAAGAAGLIKTVEAMAHETLPPSIHVTTPIDLCDGRRFVVQHEASGWSRPDGDVRRAGVSAFGFGGNNAHVVVEEPAPSRSVYASAALPLSSTLAVVGVAVRAGDAKGGLELLMTGAIGAATEVVVATDGLKVPPNDLKVAIAQQTLILEATRDVVRGLGDAALQALPPERTGIFIGMGADLEVTTPGLRFRAEDLLRRRVGDAVDPAFLTLLRDAAMPPMGASSVLGLMPNIPANRLNVQLDVRGPGFTVSSEQWSGLECLEIARMLIGAGDLDVAIVGAVEAGADERHRACVGVVGEGGDAALALVVMSPARATALGLTVLGTLDVEQALPMPAVADSGAFSQQGLQAAASLLAVGQALSQSGRDDVTVIVEGAPALRVHPAPSRRHDDVALVFGPVTSQVAPTRTAFVQQPAVAAALRRWFGDDVAAINEGARGTPGCERDLFVGALHMLSRAAFVSDALGIRVGHHIGISLGESASLVAAGVWRDPLALLRETVASRLFVDEVAGARAAVERFWAARGHAERARAWSTAVLRAPRPALEAAVAARDDVWITMWHTDDEADVAGAPDAVLAVAAAVSATPALLPDAPAVHGPVIADVAARYRALHLRDVGHALGLSPDVALWSNGVAERGGRLASPSSSSCADAIVTQASRTVDVPALVRAAWSEGVRTFLDVSPRGLVGGWIRRLLPDARVIVVDDDAVSSARALVEFTTPGKIHKTPIEPAHAVRIPAHKAPKPWPEPTTMTMPAETMSPAPRRPPVSFVEKLPPLPRRTPTTSPAPATTPMATSPTPVAPMPTSNGASSLSEPYAPRATMSLSAEATGDDAEVALLQALRAQRAALATAHASFVQTASQAHASFLASRARLAPATMLLDGATTTPATTTPTTPTTPTMPTQAPTTMTAPTPSARPAHTAAPPAPAATIVAPAMSMPPVSTMTAATSTKTATTPTKTAPVLFDRRQLESLASDTISTVLGPLFARQDRFPRQVRMPEPPLLLCDRVLSTDCTPGVLEKGRSMFTAADVRDGAWYLHDGRMPAGILIESGQADLLLISMMGVDFENQGERVYRLLGCDLTYTDHLPLVGQTLHHSITIDGFATAAISAASEARIFFFHSDTRLGDENGPIVLKVRNGQAGFFTDDELLHSGGVLWKPADEDAAAIAASAHATAPQPTTKTTLSRSELLAWATGDALGCFGPGFELCQTQVRTPSIEGPRDGRDAFGNPDGRAIDFLLIDRVTHLDLQGGPWGRGALRAELDLHEDKWFYKGHFKDDPCMPGTVMFQGCLQVAATMLAATGVIASDVDGFRFEPKLDQMMRLRCRGQAVPSSRKMVYELFVKSISGEREPELRCDILVTVDGLKSLHCADVILKLVADYPLSGRPDVRGVAPKLDGRDAIAPRTLADKNLNTPVTGFTSLISTGVGRPGAAFPGLYDVYDDGSPVARMPGPPYHFMSNVDAVSGPRMGSLHHGENPAGTKASVRYDVPADAWYFDEAQGSQGGHMPFAVLLEVALQPCGWLSSYVGSTRTSKEPLKYRNLDGTATQHREVGRDVGALVTHAELTKSSIAGGMIIQEFRFDLRTLAGEPVFSGTTVFGFFPPIALERQVGVGSSDVEKARLQAPSALPGFPMEFSDTSTWQRLQASKLQLPRLVGTPPLLMIDRVEGAWRTERGHLRVRTSKDVVLSDWFFRAHFFRDPVQPGSLGIEAMIQALQFAAAFDDVASHLRAPRFEALARGRPLTWKYRGQVVPRNHLIQVEAEVTDVVRGDDGSVTIIGDGALWVDGLRIYLAKGLAIRAVES